jgi:hypothetical protein
LQTNLALSNLTKKTFVLDDIFVALFDCFFESISFVNTCNIVLHIYLIISLRRVLYFVLTEVHDVGLVDVDEELEGVADDEDQDDPDQNCRNRQISENVF